MAARWYRYRVDGKIYRRLSPTIVGVCLLAIHFSQEYDRRDFVDKDNNSVKPDQTVYHLTENADDNEFWDIPKGRMYR